MQEVAALVYWCVDWCVGADNEGVYCVCRLVCVELTLKVFIVCVDWCVGVDNEGVYFVWS